MRALRTPLWRLLAAVLLCAAWGLAAGQPLQAVPALSGRVVDTTGTLDALQQGALDQSLAVLEKERGAQVVVLLVATTAPEDIASYANRVANVWKIGRRDIGDGVLLLVAKNDRKLRIEVAKTLEGAIPDLAARRIIDEAITPRLRQGDFAGGLQAGVAQIDARIRGEGLPEPKSSPRGADLQDDWLNQLPVLLVAVFLGVPLVASALRRVLGRKLGAVATGAGVGGFVWLILQLGLVAALAGGAIAFVVALLSGNVGGGLPTPMRRGGADARRGGWIAGAGGAGWGGGHGGGGSSSGGGFSSGGGGDFGGGGASGDW